MGSCLKLQCFGLRVQLTEGKQNLEAWQKAGSRPSSSPSISQLAPHHRSWPTGIRAVQCVFVVVVVVAVAAVVEVVVVVGVAAGVAVAVAAVVAVVVVVVVVVVIVVLHSASRRGAGVVVRC